MNGFGSLQNVTGPFDGFRADYIDSAHIEDIPDDAGDVLAISEVDADGAYICSTVSERSLGIPIEG